MARALQTTKEEWYVGSIVGKKGEYLRAVTALSAQQALRDEQSKGTFPRSRNDYFTRVDRRIGVPETQVRFGGRIDYQVKSTFEEVYKWIAERLVAESPVGPIAKKSGKAAFRRRHYITSHIVMVNRVAVVKEGDDIAKVLAFGRNMQKYFSGDKNEIAFVNIQPYARRIERGAEGIKTGRKTGVFKRGKRKGKPKIKKAYWSLQAPSGVYKKVERAARLRFRGVANIKLRYLQLAALGYKFKDRHSGKRILQFYPTLLVRPDKRGLKVINDE